MRKIERSPYVAVGAISEIHRKINHSSVYTAVGVVLLTEELVDVILTGVLARADQRL